MSSRILQPEVEAMWGVPAGVLVGLRKRGQGPHCIKLDHQQPYSYEREDAETIRDALLVLGKYRLALHGANPLGTQNEGTARADGPEDEYISLEEAADRLGVSEAIMSNWTRKVIGPRPRRWNVRRPFKYRKRDVEELRTALLVLGAFDMGLPNVKPLQH